MIEVPMTDDIRKYQPKVLGPFNFRQLFCIILAAAFALPLWGLVDLSVDNKVLVIAIVLFPIIACGWVKLDGLPFEKLIFRLIYYYFLTPKTRKYKTENTYKKAYDKNKPETSKKKKKVKITYSNKSKVYF